MARQITETFAHYEGYLRQGVYWPSESAGETTLISDMVPRYAASALSKLLRWAGTMQSQATLNIWERGERERFVRGTQLAQALGRRAQSLSAAAETIEPTEVTPRDIILAFAPVVAENTALDITQIFKLCEALATMADEEWTITVQTR